MSDVFNYIVIANPLITSAGSIVKAAGSAAASYCRLDSKLEYQMIPPEPLWKLVASCGPYIRLAGLSGATAVIIGAYGSHKEFKYPELKLIFDTANRYHIYHSLAMLGVVFSKVPKLTAAFWIGGSIMFCGSCYYYAFTDDKKFSRITPFGGMCFIAGWLTLCF